MTIRCSPNSHGQWLWHQHVSSNSRSNSAPASLEKAKISASSVSSLMSLENRSSVAKRQAKRKYFGCVSSGGGRGGE